MSRLAFARDAESKVGTFGVALSQRMCEQVEYLEKSQSHIDLKAFTLHVNIAIGCLSKASC
jgi:hypothetical protein